MEPTEKEIAIEYIRNHLESLRGQMNAITLANTNGEKDFDE